MRSSVVFAIGLSFLFAVSGCDSGSPTEENDAGRGGSGGKGGTGGDSGTGGADDTGIGGFEGPWECELPSNRATNTETGAVRPCGLFRCYPGIGCPKLTEGCDSDDDCIDSTLEIGWTRDIRVYCDGVYCEDDPTGWEGWEPDKE